MDFEEEEALIDLLRQIKEIFDKYEAEFWLECGTLLGAIRDRTFIPWERDIDFGAWSNSVSRKKKVLIERELSKRGFKVFLGENHMNIRNDRDFFADINFYKVINNNAIMKLSKPIGIIGRVLRLFCDSLKAPYHFKIDLWNKPNINFRSLFLLIARTLPPQLRRQITDRILIFYKKMGKKDVSWIVPIHYLNSFSTVEFYGMEFKVPSRTEDYLCYRYGKDWRIPRRDWITQRDDRSLQHWP